MADDYPEPTPPPEPTPAPTGGETPGPLGAPVPTTKTKDYLGRALLTPATNGRDFLGRQVQAGDKDSLGRALI